MQLDRASPLSALKDGIERGGIYRFVPAAALALVVVVLVVGNAVTGGSDDDGGPKQVAAAGTTTTTATTTSASISPVTGPPDDPQTCEARDEFTSAVSTLDPGPGMDPASVLLGLQLMSTALESLGGADDHPDLVASVDILRPVVNDTRTAISSGSTDLAALADDPRFTDPAVVAAVGTITSYALNCPTPG